MKVIVVRSPNNYLCAGEVNIAEIDNVRWSNISGGNQHRQAGYSLYGYIDYELAKNLVDCSGIHSGYGGTAKVCIPAKLNKELPYCIGYEYLKFYAANRKPTGTLVNSRPDGIPCSKMIRLLMKDKTSIFRKELRKTLVEMGYRTDTIRRALRHLREYGDVNIEKTSTNFNLDIIYLIMQSG
ncbi:hypothetical protein [Butyrivibrio sp. AE3004]|uniref:hypothetical protein n=1 Tax=Butyrivibrio sp. AE3004 TaxID=1506994 RepID=UPI000493C82A|nr:hypothetical protein [Butyrivibrio sp. AE3004]